MDAVTEGTLKPGDVVVIRYEGPKGGPGMREMLAVTGAIKGAGLGKDVLLLTDGRFSGGTTGAVHRPRRPGGRRRRPDRVRARRRPDPARPRRPHPRPAGRRRRAGPPPRGLGAAAAALHHRACWASTPSSSVPRRRARSAGDARRRPSGSTPERVTGGVGPASHAAVSDAEADGVDSRRWWLLAAAVPVALGCALATAQPGADPAGQLAVGLRRDPRGRRDVAQGCPAARPRGWRLLAVAPLMPVAGVLLTLRAGHRGPDRRVLRWAPTVPGYVVATSPSWGWSPAPAACRASGRGRGRAVLHRLPGRRAAARGRPGGQLVDVRPGRAAGPRRRRASPPPPSWPPP